jgi:hypothetical protein
MSNEWQGSGRAGSVFSAGESQEQAPAAATDPYGAIGYEAADPSLRSAQWLDTVSAPIAPWEQS